MNVSGTTSAFTTTGGIAPRMTRSLPRRSSLPMTNVSSAATSVAVEPKAISSGALMRLPSRQPTHSPTTASPQKSGSTVSTSLIRNCTVHVANDENANA